MKALGEFAALVFLGSGIAFIVARQVIADLKVCSVEETQSEKSGVQNEIRQNDLV